MIMGVFEFAFMVIGVSVVSLFALYGVFKFAQSQDKKQRQKKEQQQKED